MSSASASSSVFFVSGITHSELRLGQQLTTDHLRALQQQLAEQAERARALHQLQQAQQGLRPAAGVPVKAEPGVKKEEDGAQPQGQQQLQYAALLALQLQQQQARAAAAAAVAQQQQAAAGASGPSRRAGGGRGGGVAHGGGRGQSKQQAKAARVEEEDEQATDQWVQCSKCQQWRQVPDEFWPDIANADEDEDWLCKDALWAVEDYEPHTPACC